MRKKIICLATAACLAATMSGCARKGSEERIPSPTLAPATVGWTAPDGDGVIRKGREATLYIPEESEAKLVSRSITLAEGNLNETAEALVKALLEAVNEERADPAEREIGLTREQHAEISGGVCTVNLGPSALQLGNSEYYKLALGVAATLCKLDEIRYVNVLTANQSVALDPAGNLPMGTLTGHAGENLSVLWEQTEARKTPQGGNPAMSPLNSEATIYYPLPEGMGIGCECRRIAFEGQTAGQLASTLMDAVSETVKNRIGGADTPDLWEYMVHEPVASEMEDGGKLITLSFRQDLQELAEGWNTDIACMAAALTWTLTTFIPGVSAVCFRIGDKPVTELGSSRFTVGTILGGLMRRSVFDQFLRGSVTVFFEKNGRLIRTEKAADRESADSPRVQLAALIQGPDRREEEKGIVSPMPEGIREDDLLGIAAEGETMLVNLSGHFRDQIKENGAEKETLMCYALVNTLCYNTGMKRVCFFFEGAQTEKIAGEIYWAGEFRYNPEM